MKKLILIIAILFAVGIKAQDSFAVSVVQDVKLAFTTDDYGNDPYTIDLLIKVEKQFLQREVGYIVFYGQVELANLAGGFYSRYGAGIGYTFNVLLENLDLIPSYNYGMIRRFDTNYFGSEMQVEASYEIFKNFRLVALCTYTDRIDIGNWRANVYFGAKYKL